MRNIFTALVVAAFTMIATTSLVAYATAPDTQATNEWIDAHLDTRIQQQLTSIKQRLHIAQR